jgi:23S rRNA pseudouridine2605 synthase
MSAVNVLFLLPIRRSAAASLMTTRNADRSADATTKAPSRRQNAGQRSVARPAVLADETGTRLQKFLATAGVESRRNCESFIRDGRVTVDGVVVTNPAVSVRPEQQDVRLDGERLLPPRFKYYLVNKPKGVVCTNNDPAGRPRVIDLVPGQNQRLFTVGRLDEHTVGLMLVTNDGALAEHLAHPRYEVIRKYRVQVAGLPEAGTLAELKRGMHFSDGFFRFQSIRMLKRRGRSTFLELELREGKNREIRRLLAKAGHKVMHLERIAFGPLKIGKLEGGLCRELKPQEIRELYAFIESPPDKRNAEAFEKSKPRKLFSPRKKKSAKKIMGRSSDSQTGNRRGAARHGIKKKKAAPAKPAGRGNGRPKRK